MMEMGGAPRDVAEYTHKIKKYIDHYGVSWDEAERMMPGGRFNVGKTREIEDITEDERAVMRAERRAQREMPTMSSSGPNPADWRTTSMMGLELSSLGIKETPALAYAHELYKHKDLRGYIDEEIGRRIPSMKDIQDVYEDLADTPFREYLIKVQEMMVERFGEGVILLDSARLETLAPRLARGGPRVVGG